MHRYTIVTHNYININKIHRERCSHCNRMIYLHDVALICDIDNRIFHSFCLNISNSCAFDLIKQGSWGCPDCLKDMFPFFEDSIEKNVTSKTFKYCVDCNKHLSPTKDIIAFCRICKNILHKSCCINFLCKKCHHCIDDDEENLNYLLTILTLFQIYFQMMTILQMNLRIVKLD